MCTNLLPAWIVPQGVVSRQGRDGKINQVQTTRGQLVCTNLLPAWIVPQDVVCRQGKRWENQSHSDSNRSVSVYKLTACIGCATGCCLQVRKEMAKSIIFRQQRGQ